jgi:putative Mn2+ efflux pump MntP
VDLATIILIAVSYAMDAFAVSIAHSMTIKKRRVASGILMAGSFGMFQAFMPVLRWLAGLSFIELISGFDHWLAFGLLTLSVAE